MIRLSNVLAVVLCVGVLSACVTPSTILINREGKGVRCATTGYGYGIAGAIAITAAQSTHDQCVRDFESVGFVRVPRARLGTYWDMKSPTMRIEKIEDNAKQGGVLVGDELLELDGKAMTDAIDVLRFLNTKEPGDRVAVKLRRGDQLVTVPVMLTSRDGSSFAQVNPPPAAVASTTASTSRPPVSESAPVSSTTSGPSFATPKAPERAVSYAQLFLIKGPVVTNPPQRFSAEFHHTGKATAILSGSRRLTGDYKLFEITESIEAKYSASLIKPDAEKLTLGADAKGFAVFSDGTGFDLECAYSLTKATGRGQGTCADNQRNTYRIVFD